MDISPEKRSEAVDYMTSEIKHIITTYGTREPGSKGEIDALGHMRDELNKICDNNTSVDSFPVHPKAFFGWTYFVAIFCMLGAILFFMTPAISIICYAIALAPVFGEFLFYRQMIDPLFPKAQSGNLMGTLKPKGEVKKRFVMNGHSDAVYEWHWHRVGGYPLFLFSIIIVVVGLLYSLTIAILSCVLESPFGTPGTIGGNTWLMYMGIGQIAFFPFYLAFFMFCDHKVVVPGANDNLSACEMSIAVLKLLKENNIQFENTEVVALITGSEEAGLRGAKAFCKLHPEYGKEEGIESVFLTFETLREVDYLSIYTRDMNGITKNDMQLAVLAKECGQKNGKEMTFGSVYAGATDAAAFSQGGLKACCIAAMNPTVQDYYHTRKDDYDNLSPECLSKVLDITLDMIERFDKEGLPQLKK